jgi:hypothetical protein
MTAILDQAGQPITDQAGQPLMDQETPVPAASTATVVNLNAGTATVSG